jgi:hypothetical protein
MRSKAIVIAILLSVAPVTAQERRGVFSRSAIPIWATQSNNLIARSPDGTKAILVVANMNTDLDEPHLVTVEVGVGSYLAG